MTLRRDEMPVRSIRWGLGDVLVAWLAGLVAGILATTVLGERHGADFELGTGAFGVAVIAQNAATFGALLLISHLKGRGSLGIDFGLRLSSRDSWWLGVGVVLQVALSVLLLPIALVVDLDEAPQEAVRRIEAAGGLDLVVLAASVIVVAPFVEELLFRGLLLRALLRRMTHGWAVLVSAGVFGAVHLSDPGAAVIVPGLVALGVVAGAQATKTGSLSRPIMLHAGFNLLTVLFLIPGN